MSLRCPLLRYPTLLTYNYSAELMKPSLLCRRGVFNRPLGHMRSHCRPMSTPMSFRGIPLQTKWTWEQRAWHSAWTQLSHKLLIQFTCLTPPLTRVFQSRCKEKLHSIVYIFFTVHHRLATLPPVMLPLRHGTNRDDGDSGYLIAPFFLRSGSVSRCFRS